MVIADLITTTDAPTARVYLATAPFPGDVVRTTGGDFMVTRRTFLDLGPEAADDRLSLELKVKAL